MNRRSFTRFGYVARGSFISGLVAILTCTIATNGSRPESAVRFFAGKRASGTTSSADSGRTS